jgi:hypothetical protein
VAEELDDTARAELWPTLFGEAPQVGDFQTRLTRRIPVFILTRQDSSATRAAGSPRRPSVVTKEGDNHDGSQDRNT